tara:strand:- start:145 stop:594 length:450 start_codon:yes stop_codon:yes gene_type:complete
MQELTLMCKTFEQLSLNELYAILRLRSEVFVVEQKCVYQDVDSYDEAAFHVMGMVQGELSFYARLLSPDIKYRTAAIGRVVADRASRRKGYGKELMDFAIKQCEDLWPNRGITISAQEYLEGFYQRLGFVTTSAPYLEDEITHIKMMRS